MIVRLYLIALSIRLVRMSCSIDGSAWIGAVSISVSNASSTFFAADDYLNPADDPRKIQ